MHTKLAFSLFQPNIRTHARTHTKFTLADNCLTLTFPLSLFHLLCCFNRLLTSHSLISFTLLLIPHHPLALYLRKYAVFALPPLAVVHLAMNRPVNRSVVGSYPRGTVTMAQLLVVEVAKLHGPRNWFTQEITFICLRLGGRGAAGAPWVSSLHVTVAPALTTQPRGLPASILQGEIRGGAGAGSLGLLSVPAGLQTEQLPSGVTSGEAIVILLDAAVGQLHHLGRTVCHQVQCVVRAGATGAFVMAATAVLPVAVISTVVFAVSWLWLLLLLLLRHRFLPVDASAGHSVAHWSHPQVSTAAHHPNATFAIESQRLWAIPVLQRVADPQRTVHVVVVGPGGGQRLCAVELD